MMIFQALSVQCDFCSVLNLETRVSSVCCRQQIPKIIAVLCQQKFPELKVLALFDVACRMGLERS